MQRIIEINILYIENPDAGMENVLDNCTMPLNSRTKTRITPLFPYTYKLSHYRFDVLSI